MRTERPWKMENNAITRYLRERAVIFAVFAHRTFVLALPHAPTRME